MLKKIFFLAAFLCFASPAFAQQSFNYDECMAKATPLGDSEMAKCKRSRMLIYIKDLQNLYDEVANSEEINVVTRDEVKRMYDSWQNYRDTYCKIYADSSKERSSNSVEYELQHCLEEHTRNAFLYMRAVIDNYFSDFD